VQVAQGDLAGALKSYQDSRDIIGRLAKADPGNASGQRDLSMSYNKIGDAQKEQGDLSAARQSYNDSLAIRDRLAKSDPGNAGWQRDLAVSFDKLALAHKQSGDRAKALDFLRQGQAIMARLTKVSPDNALWREDLAWFDRKIAELAAGQDPSGNRSPHPEEARRRRLEGRKRLHRKDHPSRCLLRKLVRMRAVRRPRLSPRRRAPRRWHGRGTRFPAKVLLRFLAPARAGFRCVPASAPKPQSPSVLPLSPQELLARTPCAGGRPACGDQPFNRTRRQSGRGGAGPGRSTFGRFPDRARARPGPGKMATSRTSGGARALAAS
jgi:hypothetical protein